MTEEAQEVTAAVPGEQPLNIIKTRDDSKPLTLRALEAGQFRLDGDSAASWAKPDDTFGAAQLRQRIEPWLTALSQTEHLSVLLGAGLTYAAQLMATGGQIAPMAKTAFGAYTQIIEVEAAKSAQLAGRHEGNVEDQIRTASELLAGLRILGSSDTAHKAAADELESALSAVLTNFASSILATERSIAAAEAGQREKAFSYLVSFLMSFASRAGTRDRVHLFTTNYDRVIEAASDLAGLHLLDRFVGPLAPVFRSSRLDLDMHYNPPGIRGEPRYLEGVARFSKLHGSVDWIETEKTIRKIALPFGATDILPFLASQGTSASDAMRLMIYPNASKDRETALHPYIELFRDFAAAACRPNHTLITFGYSFGDEHINRIIEDMLTIPSCHLVVISYDDPLHRIMATYERLGRHPQVSLLIGDHVGDFATLVDHYLPKPAIDRTTFRMSELLKARFAVPSEGAGSRQTLSQEHER